MSATLLKLEQLEVAYHRVITAVQGVSLGGELREVSVFFVDLIGSSALARESDPDRVVALLNRFFAADPYANCDGSTTAPVLNVADFTCFLNQFAAGCP